MRADWRELEKCHFFDVVRDWKDNKGLYILS